MNTLRNSAIFALTVAICFLVTDATGKRSGGVRGQEAWQYVEVRPGAHMFWWLYYSQAPKAPLIIWLQGGPGASSTGFGNFGELGPLDVNLQPRNTTWLSAAHLLFIDNPVGTGFSYAETDAAFTTDVEHIAEDLVKVVQDVMATLPDFQKVPLYIFSESYGGKMTAAFSVNLYKAAQKGSVDVNFQGLAMGDSWISPLDYVLTWGPYLYATSLVDEQQLANITKSAELALAAVERGDFAEATALWDATEDVTEAVTGGVNWYNILQWQGGPSPAMHRIYAGWDTRLRRAVDRLYMRHVTPMANDALSELMNGDIRRKLGVIPENVTWGGQSNTVFAKQAGDFMKPVIEKVDWLLMNTDLQVVVYNGQLDLICDSIGTERWVRRLQWVGQEHYQNAPRKPLRDAAGSVVAYLKAYKNFSFYWILDAGHMVPADAGETALRMVKMVTGQ